MESNPFSSAMNSLSLLILSFCVGNWRHPWKRRREILLAHCTQSHSLLQQGAHRPVKDKEWVTYIRFSKTDNLTILMKGISCEEIKIINYCWEARKTEMRILCEVKLNEWIFCTSWLYIYNYAIQLTNELATSYATWVNW